MKIKIKRDRQTGEMTASYFFLPDNTGFRTRLLQRLLGMASRAVLMLDTNQRLENASEEALLGALQECAMEPLVLPTAANPQRFLGISVPRSKQEKLLIFEVSDGDVLSEKAWAALLQYDIAVGIEPKETPEIIGNRLCFGGPIYGSGLFDREIYDSVLCATVRSTFDISTLIREVENEMGL